MSLMVGYTNQSFQDVTDGAQSKQIFLDVTYKGQQIQGVT